MEIAPVPHRATRGEKRRLALGLLILAPVVLLVLLPAVLGLDRYVVTERGLEGAVGRGSVVLAREVPPSDLRVGDVITFRPPGGASGERVTRRIVSIRDGAATTEGDGAQAEPWVVPLTGSAYDRVWLGIPWIGLPFVVDGGWVLLVIAAAAAMAMAVVAGWRTPPRVPRPVREEVPVG
jgi:signal peptidase I